MGTRRERVGSLQHTRSRTAAARRGACSVHAPGVQSSGRAVQHTHLQACDVLPTAVLPHTCPHMSPTRSSLLCNGFDLILRLVVDGTQKFYVTKVYNPDADGALGHLDMSFADYPATLVHPPPATRALTHRSQAPM